MSVVGIIFSNIHDKSIPELTRLRTMASVPFGCRYRLIDFTLSNMVNSGIKHVGIITHYNYQSLMDHLGSGIDWDLARRSGGIQILPPYITAFANTKNFLYTTRLEALKNIASFINECKEEYVVLSDCDVICNIDLNDVIEKHIESGADVTYVTKRVDLTFAGKGNIRIRSDSNNVITSMEESQGNETGPYDINTNILVMKRRFLVTELMEATAHNYTSFTHDIIARELKKRRRKKQGRKEESKGHRGKQISALEFGLLAVSMSVDGVVSGIFILDLPVTGGQIFFTSFAVGMTAMYAGYAIGKRTGRKNGGNGSVMGGLLFYLLAVLKLKGQN